MIIGLVIGGGGVALGWLLTGGTTSATGPAAEAQAACIAIRGARLPAHPRGWTLAEADRWVGAGALAQAAGKADGRYVPLSDALNKIGNAIQQFDTGSSQVTSAAAQAESSCAAMFP